jgi:hypothetical protein
MGIRELLIKAMLISLISETSFKIESVDDGIS